MTTYFYCIQVVGSTKVYSGCFEITNESITSDGYRKIKEQLVRNAVIEADKKGLTTMASHWTITALNKI